MSQPFSSIINQLEVKSNGEVPKTVFLIGSRTGGPLIPLLAVRDELLLVYPDLKYIIVGIRGGFEEMASKTEGIPLIYLPEIKNRQLPDSPTHPVGRLSKLVFSLYIKLILGMGLLYSTARSVGYLIKYRPALILSMSNFVSVPVIWAAALVNATNRFRWLQLKIGLPRIKIAIHQLDPENQTVKLTARFADLLTAGFPEIVQKLGPLAEWVPNPVRRRFFDNLNKVRAIDDLVKAEIIYASPNLGVLPLTKFYTNPSELKPLIKSSKVKSSGDSNKPKPLLLVFGGGSGAEFINQWVFKHINDLLSTWQVLHLTGFLQQNGQVIPKQQGYYPQRGLTNLMPAALVAADCVIARAGMSTISELLYLQKPAFLVPIPGSHQEQNAAAAQEYFGVWRQAEVATWVKDLETSFGHNFQNIQHHPWDYYTETNKQKYLNLILQLLHKQ